MEFVYFLIYWIAGYALLVLYTARANKEVTLFDLLIISIVSMLWPIAIPAMLIMECTHNKVLWKRKDKKK